MTNRLNPSNTFPQPRSASSHTGSASGASDGFLPEVNQWIGDVKGVAESISANTSLPHGAVMGYNGTATRALPTGPITDLIVINAGNGYTTAPTLTVEDGGQSAQIRFSVRNDGGGFHGEIDEATIINGGRNYSSHTTITIPPPDQTVGETNPPTRRIQATATPTIVNGQITAVTITERGAGYNPTSGTTYNATIADPGTGSGATATCALDSGVVTGVSLTTEQSRTVSYTSVPTVSVTGGGGSGCQIVPEVAHGIIIRMNIVKRGTGYTSAPTISISGGGITHGHPVFTATLTTGIIKSATITAAGTGYNAPRVIINAPSNHLQENRGVILALARTSADTNINQFRPRSTTDDNSLLIRLVPTQSANNEIYSLSIGDGRVKQYLNINLDNEVANVYFYDMIQRTNTFNVVHNITGRTNEDGTAEVISSIQGFTPTAEISIAEVVEEKIVENAAPELDVDALSSQIESVRTSLEAVVETIVGTPYSPTPDIPDPDIPTPDVPTPDVPSLPSLAPDIEQIQANSIIEAFGNEVAEEVTTEQIDHGISQALGGNYQGGGSSNFDDVAVDSYLADRRRAVNTEFEGVGLNRTQITIGGALVAAPAAAAVTTIGVVGALGVAASSVFATNVVVLTDDVVFGTPEEELLQEDIDRGTSDPLGDEFDPSGRKSPPRPRPDPELPSRGEGGASGQGEPTPSRSPSGAVGGGVRGAQGRVVTVPVTIPTQVVIDKPRNLEAGQSVELYFRHYIASVPTGHAPIFTLDRSMNTTPINSQRQAGLGGLIQSIALETGERTVYQVKNEIVGIKITKLSDDSHIVESLGIWPNKTTI